MLDSKVKNNYFTYPERRPPKVCDNGEIEKILSRFSDFPYELAANICGAKIMLKRFPCMCTSIENLTGFQPLKMIMLTV